MSREDIIGEVRAVSDFPATPEGLRRTLRNVNLVAALTDNNSAPIEVIVRLSVDESTPSGYHWSSSQGPPVQVFTGTLCSASVEVESSECAARTLCAAANWSAAALG